MLPTEGGLVFIHQHRAHITLLYHQLIEQLSQTQGAMQQLLFPEVYTLQPDEMVLFEQLLPDLRAIGFDAEQLSADSYSIQGIPTQMANQSALPVLQTILHAVRERGANTQQEWREQIALSLAEASAIAQNKSLTEMEMRDLVLRLIRLPFYRLTPDGKTILFVLTDEDILKRF